MKSLFLDPEFLQIFWSCLFYAGFLLVALFLLQNFLCFKKKHLKNKVAVQEQSFSIIIPVLNDEDRLVSLVKNIFSLKHPTYELILVDQGSEDDSIDLMQKLCEQYSRLKYSFVSADTWCREKMAINLGMKAAKYDRIILLSPTICELRPNWLNRIEEQLSTADGILFAYENVLAGNSFMHNLCRAEQFFNFWRSARFLRARFPFFMQQNNICFLKEHYFRLDGFRGMMKDDFATMELVLNRIHPEHVDYTLDHSSSIFNQDQLIWENYKELVLKRSGLEHKCSFQGRFLFHYQKFGVLLLLAGTIGGWIYSLSFWLYWAGCLVMLFIIYSVWLKKAANCLQEKKIFLSSLMSVCVRPLFAGYCRVLTYVRLHRKK